MSSSPWMLKTPSTRAVHMSSSPWMLKVQPIHIPATTISIRKLWFIPKSLHLRLTHHIPGVITYRKEAKVLMVLGTKGTYGWPTSIGKDHQMVGTVRLLQRSLNHTHSKTWVIGSAGLPIHGQDGARTGNLMRIMTCSRISLIMLRSGSFLRGIFFFLSAHISRQSMISSFHVVSN